MHPIGSYWVVLSLSASHWVLLGHIESQCVPLGPIGSFWVPLCPVGSFWVPLVPIDSLVTLSLLSPQAQVVANNDEKRSFSVTYVPKVAGLHKVGDTNVAHMCPCVTVLSPRVPLCHCGAPMSVTVSLRCPHVCHCVTEVSPCVSLSP